MPHSQAILSHIKPHHDTNRIMMRVTCFRLAYGNLIMDLNTTLYSWAPQLLVLWT